MKKVTKKYLTVFAIAFGFTFVWAGCDPGSSPSTPSSPALIDACGLLTNAEATVILGKAIVTAKMDTGSGYITHCSYQADLSTGAGILPPHIDLTVFNTAGMQDHFHSTTLNVPSNFATLKSTTPAADQLQLTGIGNDAIWLKKPGKLELYKGDVEVSVIFSLNGTPLVDTSAASLNGAKAAGIKVAAKL